MNAIICHSSGEFGRPTRAMSSSRRARSRSRSLAEHERQAQMRFRPGRDRDRSPSVRRGTPPAGLRPNAARRFGTGAHRRAPASSRRAQTADRVRRPAPARTRASARFAVSDQPLLIRREAAQVRQVGVGIAGRPRRDGARSRASRATCSAPAIRWAISAWTAMRSDSDASYGSVHTDGVVGDPDQLRRDPDAAAQPARPPTAPSLR